jgi:hypothetical protein
MVLSLLACRPNHARHVGAGRALVCDQPIRVLQGQDPSPSRSVFLHRGHAKLPCLLGASATIKPLRKHLNEGQHTTVPAVRRNPMHVRIFFEQISHG